MRSWGDVSLVVRREYLRDIRLGASGNAARARVVSMEILPVSCTGGIDSGRRHVCGNPCSLVRITVLVAYATYGRISIAGDARLKGQLPRG